MKFFAKTGAKLLLVASILTTTSITAYAWQNVTYPDGGKWTYGVSQPGNGY